MARKLNDFYATAADYVAFSAPSNQTRLWDHLASELRKRLQAAPDRELRVLEVGAGRS